MLDPTGLELVEPLAKVFGVELSEHTRHSQLSLYLLFLNMNRDHVLAMGDAVEGFLLKNLVVVKEHSLKLLLHLTVSLGLLLELAEAPTQCELVQPVPIKTPLFLPEDDGLV